MTTVLAMLFAACSTPVTPPPAPIGPGDISGIPIPLAVDVVSVVAAPSAGAPALTVQRQADDYTIVVTNAAVCDSSGMRVAANREPFAIDVGVDGGTACAAGQAGTITLHTHDQRTHAPGEAIVVHVGSADVTGLRFTLP